MSSFLSHFQSSSIHVSALLAPGMLRHLILCILCTEESLVSLQFTGKCATFNTEAHFLSITPIFIKVTGTELI